MVDRSEILAAYSSKALLKDLLASIKPYRWRFAFASFLRLTSDLVWLYPAFALASIVSLLSEGDIASHFPQIQWILVLWMLASVWHYIARDVAKFIGFQVAEKVNLDKQKEVISHMMRLDMHWQERENSGNKVKRIQRGGEGFLEILRIWLVNYIEIGVNLVGMTFIVATFDRTIALGFMIFMVTYYALAYAISRKAGEATSLTNIEEEHVHGLSFEAINNIRTVKALGMEKGFLKKLQNRMSVLLARIRTRVFWFRVRDSSLSLWGQTFRLVAIAFIVYEIIQGRYEVGFLVIFYEYFNRILDSIAELSEVSQRFMVARYGIGRMKEILHEPLGIDDETGKVDLPEEWQTIEVKNLHFSYGSKTVLNGIDIVIRRGERIGIVGLSGAGKSTLFKLLLKEHERYEGDILIDGTPLTSIKKSSYFEHAATVLQDTEVFHFTLAENILMANPKEEENQELLSQALAISHVSDFLPKLPNGMHTELGEKGVRLSGGERQRVGIARAVFKRPQIVFMDEATSHLDVESEEKIRDSFHNFFQSVTAVVIAHRLSTIREMDRIYVLEDGKVLEEGNFDDLYGKKGRFYELWEKQRF